MGGKNRKKWLFEWGSCCCISKGDYKYWNDWHSILPRSSHNPHNHQHNILPSPPLRHHHLPHPLEENRFLPHAPSNSQSIQSFYLCISCMVQNLYVLIYPPVEVHQAQIYGQTATGFCVFESMLKTASDLSSIIWTLIIIYSSYATVVHGYTLERL